MELRILYEGDFVTPDHKLTLRTLSRTLISVQRGLDRAAIYNQNDRVWKYAKLDPRHYNDHDFYFSSEAGSFRAILLAATEQGNAAVNMLRNNIRTIHQAIDNDLELRVTRLHDDYNNRLVQLQRPNYIALEYNELLGNEELITRYVTRTIAKETDQVLSSIRQESAGESFITFEFVDGQITERYVFNRRLSEKYHQFVAFKQLGDPVTYMGLIFEINSNSRTARIEHLEQALDLPGKSLLKFKNEDSFNEFNDSIRPKQIGSFLGCPILEADGYDPISGDIMYLGNIQQIAEEIE